MEKKIISGVAPLFVLISLLTIGTNAQTQSQKSAINKLTAAFSSRTIVRLNRNRYSYKYKLERKNVFYGDLNNDGQFDAVVELFFCERTSCHPTTNSSELVVYSNRQGKFTFAAFKRFSLFGKINSVEDGKIFIDVYGLDEDDPQCCPQLKRSEVYSLRNNKLIRVRG